jgi:hypothetical protein
MLRKSIAALAAFFLSAGLLSAQNIVSVNPSTGTANAVIPIYAVSSGQITVPISISYSATGVKTRDVENSAGMSWQLNAGGAINRVVRGLPDDVSQDSSGASRYGWMLSTNTGAAYATSFNPQNDDSTCTKGQTDISNINTYMPFQYDTEPDLFYVNAPGLSMEMVYDRVSGAFHPVNYQDVIISYTQVGGTGKNQYQIASFSITNGNGWVYKFAAPEKVYEKTVNTSGVPNYLTTKYNQYVNGITYYDSWNLVSITDPNGNAVTMTYTTALTRNSTDSVNLYLAGATTKSYQYSVAEAVTPKVLSTMSSTTLNGTNQRLNFGFNTPGPISQTGQAVVTAIFGMGHNWVFNYNAVSYQSHYTRAFLTSFADPGCSTPVYYQFIYNGVNTTNNTTILPDSTSTHVDYWGYYSSTATGSTLQPYVYVNPSTATYPRYLIAASGTAGSAYTFHAGEYSRAVSATDIADGSLSKIIYAQGGSTTLVYEPNDYYDPTVAATVKGGGIRIKQVIDSAGSGTTNRIVRNYTYFTSGGSQSSGVPITLPQFAFTIPYSGSGTGQTLWTDASAQSDYDLSPDDHTILYAWTTLSQLGAGETVYNSTTPGTFWQGSSAPSCSGCSTEWYPTLNYAASYNCPATTGPIANLTYSYPFAPNPNYDFERGLPISVINYTDGGTSKVSETDYTYSRSYSSPSVITAFRSDDGPASIAKFYNKYFIYYGTSELTASATTKVYDNQTYTNAQTSTTNYAYASTYHKLLSSSNTTNSDGSTVTNTYYYVKDYNASSSSNANIQALYELRLANENLPVESYQTVMRSGTNYTTAGSLLYFSASTNGSTTHYLPAQQYRLTQPNGETAFSKFSIASGSPVRDTGYVCVSNFDQYDNTAYPQTVDDNHKRVVSSCLDLLSNKPTAVFKNAHYNEVAWQDFDSQFAPTVTTFTITGSGPFTPVGSHAGKAAGMASGQSITSGTVTKNTSAVNYILSFWMSNTASTQLTFTASSLGTKTYPAASWTYYEYTIPASALGATFTTGFSTNQNISVDDILLYPDVSEAATTTYNDTTLYKICQTNTNGVSAYFANDQWGRMLYARDQDFNITQRNQFLASQNYQNFYKPVIDTPSVIYAGIPARFTNSAPESCFTGGMYYVWNFGDGVKDTTTSSAAVSHTYALAGPYTMTLTVFSPLLGTKVDTLLIGVTNLPYTHVTYTNTCTPGGHIPSLILKVTFTPTGTGTSYTFSTAQLEAGQNIIPAEYNIAIYPEGTEYNSVTNPTGWGSVIYTGATSQCFPYGAGPFNVNYETLTYTESVNFEIQPGSCSP